MDGKTHLTVGLASGATVIGVKCIFDIDISFLDSVYLIGACGFGSLLPDIDQEYSILGRFIPAWLVCKHRAQTHSLAFMLVIGWVAYSFHAPISIILALMLGIATHLLLDAITPMGLPYLFYPIYYNRHWVSKYLKKKKRKKKRKKR